MKYSRKVRATTLVSVGTLKACSFASTQSTYVFYTEESDSDDENSKSVEDRATCDDAGKPVEDAISTIQEEIAELDTMGFDETLLLAESVDM